MPVYCIKTKDTQVNTVFFRKSIPSFQAKTVTVVDHQIPVEAIGWFNKLFEEIVEEMIDYQEM